MVLPCWKMEEDKYAKLVSVVMLVISNCLLSSSRT